MIVLANDPNIEIPGLAPLPTSSIPPPFFSPYNPFTTLLASNARSHLKANGVLLNIFDWFDTETIAALNNGEVLSDLPSFYPVGPFEPYELEKGHHHLLTWLDEKAAQSVIYVSFGSRTTMSKDQIRDLGEGLEQSGHRFLWVLKGHKLDKDDTEGVRELVGESFVERTKQQGLVLRGWVEQEEFLAHTSVGGFVSHCGWNSVMEAARRGVPVLAWPQAGDQKINAGVLEKAGLGLWVRDWGKGGERLVKGEEIGDKVIELMGNEKLRAKARKVGEEARKAGMAGGGSDKALMEVIEMLTSKEGM
ncbi:hypothetical protein RJ639_040500 [Escallonia herrerae]|uniref:UDP-glycosyltransferases domain-containing protein n=1 Tax=Escallonia herrerae TaxID=1293975 RepID=A0AA88WIF1_9ASTE|nr:hypothetical protein RJ639_040500 [Escallonia herrerae]